MFPIPSPLHPAVVHFPIVLLLIGAGVAVVSVFIKRWHLPWIAASLLAIGAIGAFVAVETGEAAQEIVGDLVADTEQLLDSHQEWAERTEIVAAITAVLAVLTAALGEWVARLNAHEVENAENKGAPSTIARWAFRPTVSYAARMITAAAALVSCFFVYQTARRGGELVYDHGVGINVEAIQARASSIPPS